jgi:hypothetical protein
MTSPLLKLGDFQGKFGHEKGKFGHEQYPVPSYRYKLERGNRRLIVIEILVIDPGGEDADYIVTDKAFE